MALESFRGTADDSRVETESDVLSSLDRALRSPGVSAAIAGIVARVRRHLAENPGAALAWEPIPLAIYGSAIPDAIRSSWVFILRAGSCTGAERHPNSVQRMVSWEGEGDFPTRTGDVWESHPLTSDPAAPLARRWISIPADVWHQGVVPGRDWVVVSFHTAGEGELIEERELAGSPGVVEAKSYAGRHAH